MKEAAETAVCLSMPPAPLEQDALAGVVRHAAKAHAALCAATGIEVVVQGLSWYGR